MKIKSIELSNWRAYQSATFNFDIEDVNKNCILIGAPNGFGKTSLFEAITLCVYGKKGLPLLVRASEAGKIEIPYDKFLSKVIHKSALKSSSRQLSVKISFHNTGNEKIRIERLWYFTPAGIHKAGEEQFAIWINDQVQVPDHGQDRSEWEAELINRYFIPHSLAQFFLFDGERVRDLARMDQATQVKRGIEGLMGVPILRNLSDSLMSYSVRKRSRVRTPKSKTSAAELGSQIEEASEKIKSLSDEISNLELEVSKLDEEQKDLFKELATYGSTHSAKKSELHQSLYDAEREREAVSNQLQNKLVSDFSMGMVGQDLIQMALNLLASDQLLEDWESSRNQGEKGFDNFIGAVKRELNEKSKKIPTEYHPMIIDIVKSTWGSIWYPKPTGCPDKHMFPELHGQIRNKVRERLDNLLKEAGTGLQNSFSQLDKLENEINKTKLEIRTSEAIGPRQEEISSRLTEIGTLLNEKNTARGSKINERDAEEAEKNAKMATLKQITGLEDDAKPILEFANRAEHISKVARKIIEEIVPLQSKELAEKMSEIYRELSNKSLVKKVEIDSEFNVKLIGENEDDIRANEMSAGEEQIFSQTLIFSVVQVSNFDFPMIIDTPLARLSDDHRKSILEYFKNSSRQIVFLSTDTEIIGKYLELLKDNISNTYKLIHQNSDGVGFTSIEKGYFQ